MDEKVDKKTEDKQNIEILQYNVDLRCDYKCADCSRYFDCTDKRKADILNYWAYKATNERMKDVKHKLVVLSGKGGVGKSTVSANLAAALAARGYKTGVVDLDLMGPSIPRLLGVADKKMYLRLGEGILPVINEKGIKVMSMAHTLKDNEAVVWFHDMKKSAVEGFLTQVLYGELDYLVIDLPPGTGTEVSSVMRYLSDMDGAIIVTIPSEVSQKVARKAITLCNRAGIPVLGVIENMSGFVCSHCGEEAPIFNVGGGIRMAEEMGVPVLGRIPLEEIAARDSDEGKPFVTNHPDSASAKAFERIVDQIEDATRKKQAVTADKQAESGDE
jgi:ATP-binding protein involved in chromosome partitioning